MYINLNDKSIAPTVSIMKVNFIIFFTLSLKLAYKSSSSIKIISEKLILFFIIVNINITIVIKPIAPISTNIISTNWPKNVNWSEIVTGVYPVVQTPDVEINRESIYETGFLLHIGKVKKSAPIKIISIKLKIGNLYIFF